MPFYKISYWNVHKRVEKNLPRSNNSIEAWHKSLSQDIGSHPSVNKLAKHLKSEQHLTDVLLEQIRGGLVYPRKKSEIIRDSEIESRRFDCFKHCSQQNNCEYLKYKSNECFLYLSLSSNEPLDNGTFWFKYNQNKIFSGCTITTITTTAAFYYNSGLATNYSISSMINNGFEKVFDKFYSHQTNYSDIANATRNCNSNSIFCAGGGLINSDFLDLVACGNCFQILTNTTLNTPKLVGSVYWYLTPGKSFGFSPSFKITQATSDTYNESDPLRLSWHIDQPLGGWRLGSLTLNDERYRKVLMVKN
ncbi:unnamed protein product [Brachionus calyciflorus]|uniref:Uncharacterized protein n=1 Tax=Brachionus calyciflorus TaxID=104777 RepID=A0A814B934_9BILA|nr:unnamed protein product [Brachionus calyciflorus]